MAGRPRKIIEEVKNEEVKNEKLNNEEVKIQEKPVVPKKESKVVDNDNSKTQVDLLIAQNELLKTQLEMLMQSMKNNQNNNQSNEEDEEILVGCRAFSGCPLTPIGEPFILNFSCGEEKYIPLSQIREIFKPSILKDNKKLFEKGLFYFADESNYKRFKINYSSDLKPENIIKIILDEDTHAIIRNLDNITRNKSEQIIMHTIMFEISLLLLDSSKPLRDWRYENRVELENYFGIKFDQLNNMVNLFKSLPQNQNIKLK